MLSTFLNYCIFVHATVIKQTPVMQASSAFPRRSGGASPLFVAGQSQDISRIRKGSRYTNNVLWVLSFQLLFIVSKTSTFRTCWTVIRNCTVVKHTSFFLHTP